MTVEFPENRNEVSDAEWQQLEQEASYYRDLVRLKAKTASRSYGHILRNLVFSFHPDLLGNVSPEERFRTYHDAVSALDYVKRYLRLLKDFPEFAEKELKPGVGYFPEMMNKLSGSKPFVDAYEAELRGRKEAKS